ncbi:MAG TPA: DUF6492 family protein [Verrucomicrobiae bacterium]|jgi:hypothetical protein
MNAGFSSGRLGSDQRLSVVTTCRARDLSVLQITAQKLAENVPLKSLCVIAPATDCRTIAARLGGRATVVSEDEFLPGMTIAELKKILRPHFPQAAGWYFQQFLKLQYAFEKPDEDYYLIWDADTVPLRPMQFFDPQGQMLLTRAQEYHSPYFETYERLLQEPARRECSFIAQHIIVQKSVAREMLSQIERRGDGQNWAWSIMRGLPDQGDNLFSEYETYGHYVKNHYPDRVRLIERHWLREGTQYTNGWIPKTADLNCLGRKYDYAAFERASQNWMQWGRRKLKRWMK